MIEVIKERQAWNLFISEFSSYDFYHTFDYHSIAKSSNEIPVLLKYTEKDIVIALPLLIRDIKDFPSYKDATSVYGYAGPLSKGVSENFNNKNFQESLNKYFKNNNIISVFSRLNPFIDNQKVILKNFGNIVLQGKVVNVDITLEKKVQRANYQSRLKTHINKSRRHCTIKKATSKNDIQTFINIYNENMNRLNATKSYYFSEDYFTDMISAKGFETEILLAIENESKKIIGGSMFIKTNSIIQYHLSGSKEEFLKLMPAKLLIDEMRLLATDQGYDYYNLGGGLGGCINDSLFKFKSSFSKDFKNFNLWKCIINKEVYDELSKNKNKESLYFPLYRS
jgi:small nuclear ribonucleoprotein (snRNP)-like protein